MSSVFSRFSILFSLPHLQDVNSLRKVAETRFILVDATLQVLSQLGASLGFVSVTRADVAEVQPLAACVQLLTGDALSRFAVLVSVSFELNCKTSTAVSSKWPRSVSR